MSADDETPAWVETLEQLGEPDRVKSGIGYKIWSHGEMLSRTDTEAVSLDAFAAEVGEGTEARNMDDYGREQIVQQLNSALEGALEDAFGDRMTVLVDEDVYDTIRDHLPGPELDGDEADAAVYGVRGQGEPESLEALVTYEGQQELVAHSIQPASEDNLDALESAAGTTVPTSAPSGAGSRTPSPTTTSWCPTPSSRRTARHGRASACSPV